MHYFCFFQAEDGIRDIGVTGVQTCALPIWPKRVVQPAERGGHAPPCGRPLRLEAEGERRDGRGDWTLPALCGWIEQRFGRSEERRVGEEGRSRWLPSH